MLIEVLSVLGIHVLGSALTAIGLVYWHKPQLELLSKKDSAEWHIRSYKDDVRNEDRWSMFLWPLTWAYALVYCCVRIVIRVYDILHDGLHSILERKFLASSKPSVLKLMDPEVESALLQLKAELAEDITPNPVEEVEEEEPVRLRVELEPAPIIMEQKRTKNNVPEGKVWCPFLRDHATQEEHVAAWRQWRENTDIVAKKRWLNRVIGGYSSQYYDLRDQLHAHAILDKKSLVEAISTSALV